MINYHFNLILIFPAIETIVILEALRRDHRYLHIYAPKVICLSDQALHRTSQATTRVYMTHLPNKLQRRLASADGKQCVQSYKSPGGCKRASLDEVHMFVTLLFHLSQVYKLVDYKQEKGVSLYSTPIQLCVFTAEACVAHHPYLYWCQRSASLTINSRLH